MKRTSSSYSKDNAGRSLLIVEENDSSCHHHHDAQKRSPLQPKSSSSFGHRRRRKLPFRCTFSSLFVSVMLIVIISISSTMVVKKFGENNSRIAEPTAGAPTIIDTNNNDGGRLLRLASLTARNTNNSNNNMTTTVFSSALNNTSSSSQPTSSSYWYWIGIVRDAAEIQPAIWDYMVKLNCLDEHPIMVHILVSTNKEYGIKERNKRRHLLLQKNQLGSCAPFLIEDEHDDTIITLHDAAVPGPVDNRVQRISRIRDAQRERLRWIWKEHRRLGGGRRQGVVDASVMGEVENNNNNNDDIVMVADLDLYSFPPINKIIDQIKNMNQQNVVCAAGVTMAQEKELWYYDTFALIFLPDTFAHPIKRRLVKHFYLGENHTLVRSDNQNDGAFTQGDIMRYLKQTASQSSTGNAPVRSCFAGLAIYRASTYFTDECQYSVQLPPPPSISGTTPHHPLYRYASEHDGRPCEHVVFHTCLHDTAAQKSQPPVQIAVNPNLIAWWKMSH